VWRAVWSLGEGGRGSSRYQDLSGAPGRPWGAEIEASSESYRSYWRRGRVASTLLYVCGARSSPVRRWTHR